MRPQTDPSAAQHWRWWERLEEACECAVEFVEQDQEHQGCEAEVLHDILDVRQEEAQHDARQARQDLARTKDQLVLLDVHGGHLHENLEAQALHGTAILGQPGARRSVG